MPSFRLLRGIVNGLVETFISRNNDVSGYWGIGQLQREIGSASPALIELDLLHGHAKPDGPIAREVAGRYAVSLSERLVRAGFTPSAVTSAKIVIQFGTFGNARAPDLFSTLGQPFNCKAVLVSPEGKLFCAARGGLCRPHNPMIETRSLRAT